MSDKRTWDTGYKWDYEPDEIEFVDFGLPVTQCAICHVDVIIERHKPNYSVSMYEGVMVDPEQTDEWAGEIVCFDCFLSVGQEQ